MTLISLLMGTVIFSTRIHAAPLFNWPATGYLGWTYTYPNGTEFGHNGLDIWGNSDGTWSDNSDPQNGDGPSWNIYPVANGQVVYSSSTTAGGGLSIKHNDGLYTFYWHVKNINVSTNDNVTTSSILGEMNYLPADAYRIVHVHLTVANSNSDSSQIDPSPYFDKNLDFGSNGYNVTYLESVTRSVSTSNPNINCGTFVVQVINKNLSGNIDCRAVDQIMFLGETKILPGSNARFYLGN